MPVTCRLKAVVEMIEPPELRITAVTAITVSIVTGLEPARVTDTLTEGLLDTAVGDDAPLTMLPPEPDRTDVEY